jgi:hypothetical protein
MKFVLVLTFVLAAVACTDSRPVVTAAEHAEATKAVAALQSIKAVTRVDCAAHEAAITSATWLGLDAQKKKQATIMLAIACAEVGTPTTPRITVIDHQSGQKLATVGAFGYTLEPR